MDLDIYPTIRLSNFVDKECSIKHETTYLSIEVIKRSNKSFFARVTSKSCYPQQHVAMEEHELKKINELLFSLKEATK